MDIIKNWIELYKKAWEERDPEGVVSIFSPDAVYWETPFLNHNGRDAIYRYWQDVPCQTQDITFAYKILNAEEGLAHWTAEFTKNDQKHFLDGIFILSFDDQGRCSLLREWWHSKTEK